MSSKAVSYHVGIFTGYVIALIGILSNTDTGGVVAEWIIPFVAIFLIITLGRFVIERIGD